ncbi:hypothetical protein CEUSTIGMA_g4323.t1 [Chlamydomonas eustigma]|uniref:Peptidase C14 caspase domain-containing protein n=1 Tax=Chlamydomonas eustigma TaxID=1157962 RepID=A0A250X1B6_9CHLO|nr:hypothetical protein CEUSTIGMA_g4323.t1 [Chlamydomonas eustigma]|eukprot:GAX76877.1 hypothetical protein CEUSTIGMA_g4323.t1 [Chlamydomonas eustigma]
MTHILHCKLLCAVCFASFLFRYSGATNIVTSNLTNDPYISCGYFTLGYQLWCSSDTVRSYIAQQSACTSTACPAAGQYSSMSCGPASYCSVSWTGGSTSAVPLCLYVSGGSTAGVSVVCDISITGTTTGTTTETSPYSGASSSSWPTWQLVLVISLSCAFGILMLVLAIVGIIYAVRACQRCCCHDGPNTKQVVPDTEIIPVAAATFYYSPMDVAPQFQNAVPHNQPQSLGTNMKRGQWQPMTLNPHESNMVVVPMQYSSLRHSVMQGSPLLVENRAQPLTQHISASDQVAMVHHERALAATAFVRADISSVAGPPAGAEGIPPPAGAVGIPPPAGAVGIPPPAGISAAPQASPAVLPAAVGVSRKALLVGCNYPGTKASLEGCVNDVWAVQGMLTNIYFGFLEADIEIMIDTDKKYIQPSGLNIKAKLADMVAAAKDGDELVFHFSGHGTQVPTTDKDELDGKDEAICPTDMNIICDNDLHNILAPLSSRPNVKFTFIADCCHSGTLLDHEQVIITGPKEGGPPPPDPHSVAATQSMLASPHSVDPATQGMLASLGAGTKDVTQLDDAGVLNIPNASSNLRRPRSLSYEELCAMLSELMPDGKKVGGAEGGSVHHAMLSLFGEHASGKSRFYQGLKTGFQHLGDQISSGFSSLFHHSVTGDHQPAAAAAASSVSGGPHTSSIPAPTPGPSGLSPDVGILFTGCQDKETSADARPATGKPHGAFTNALVAVVHDHAIKVQNGAANYPLTCRNLVLGVRHSLVKSGFAQSPCLECSLKWADTPFIVH